MFVGESDEKGSVEEALFPDMWMGRCLQFLKSSIGESYKLCSTSLFVALFTMTYKIFSVIDESEHGSSESLRSTTNIVFQNIDNFCTNFNRRPLIEDLVDGTIIGLTYISEGKLVRHY